jgi:RNA recognition motif-containing protein
MATSNCPYGSLCINQLSKYCTENELIELFQGFGPIISAKIIMRNDINALGLVTLSSFEAAGAARMNLDGFNYMGNKLR